MINKLINLILMHKIASLFIAGTIFVVIGVGIQVELPTLLIIIGAGFLLIGCVAGVIYLENS